MASRKVARAQTGFTPDEQEVLDRANAAARARIAAEGGRSIIDQLWDEMDAVLGLLLGEYANVTDEDYTTEELEARAHGELRGQCQGVAYALACMTQPYGERDVDAIRAEAMRRQEPGEEARPRPRRRPKRS
jgi:hypothetical protein